MATYETYPVRDHEFDEVSFPVKVRTYDYAYTDLVSNAYAIPIPAGTVILGVGHEVRTAFTGGTPAINIGDGSSTTYWIAAASITPGSQGNFYNSIGNTASGGGGRKYNSAGSVVVTHATDLAAGAGRVYVFMLDLNTNWRTTGQWTA